MILAVNGVDATAHRANGLLYAKGDTDHSFKPGHWLSAGGFPEDCAARFAEGDPTTGYSPGPPAPPSTRVVNEGEKLCENAAQGTIYARKLPDGRLFLCRSYPNDPAFEACGFVPRFFAKEVCGLSASDVALFAPYDPRLYTACP